MFTTFSETSPAPRNGLHRGEPNEAVCRPGGQALPARASASGSHTGLPKEVLARHACVE